MFEFRQDSAILQGAFLSAQRQVPNGSLYRLSKNELGIVTGLVTDAVALAKRGSWSANWKSSDAFLTDLRCHATIFYSVLRSSGIICNAAENYYSAVSSIFPAMDWSVYVALLKSCQWCEFFIECVTDIPHEVTACILENMLVQVKDDRDALDYYILNSILKFIIQKLLNFKPVPVLKKIQEVPPHFKFPFVYVPTNNILHAKEDISSLPDANDQEVLNDEEITHESLKPLTFSELLHEAIVFETDEMDKVEVLKIFLHGLLSLLDISVKLRPKYLLKKFDLVVPVVLAALNCLQSKTSRDYINLALSNFSTTSVQKDLVFDQISWNVDIAYLAFLICGGWNELSSHLSDCNEINQESAICKLGEIAAMLFQFFPLNKEDSSEEKEFIKVLVFIADNKFIGMNYVLEVFVQHPSYLEKEEIISCLERSTPQPAKETLRYALLNVIMEQQISQKNRLIYVFFHAMQGASLSDQQQILQRFLSKYGLNETLKQQDFSKQMSPVLNQTVNAEQAEKEIILLCLQSPRECVSRIIRQAVHGNSGHIPVLAKMLKMASCVCAFRISQETSLLVDEFKSCFSSTSLAPHQLKNIKIMTQELLEVLEDKDGFKPSEFLIQCVFPCISSEFSSAHLFSLLEIIEIVFSSTLSAEKTNWLDDLNVPAFVICMGQIINITITEMNGNLKEKAVSVLNLLSELQNLQGQEETSTLDCQVLDSWVIASMSSVNPVVYFYIQKSIEKYTSPNFTKIDLSSASLDLMWLYSCIHKEKLSIEIKEHILQNYDSNHNSLLAVSLTQILPHLTLQEWLHSSILLEECLEFLAQESVLLQHDLTDRNLRLPACVGIFVDALLLLRACSDTSLDWSYILCNFTKVVDSQINEETQELFPKTYSLLFVELCRLSSHLEEEYLKLITVLLLDIFKILKELVNALDDGNNFFSCLYVAASTMPHCVARSNVLNSMKAF